MILEVEVKARDMQVNDQLYDYVTSKTEKLKKYLKDIQSARVELTHAKSARQATDRYVAEITIWGKGYTLRAEERTDDITASFDEALEKLQRRMERYKGKRSRGRGDGTTISEDALQEMGEGEEEESSPVVIARRKKFNLVPMDEMEAIEQSNLLGHEDFFVFYNVETSSVNVLYRRRDSTFGLIDTEVV